VTESKSLEASRSSSTQTPKITTGPGLGDNEKELSCIICNRTMFYSRDNLMHVCLNEGHGVLCFYEIDNCWFAAKENTALELARKGLKFHIIPQKIFENAGLDPGTFQCDYK
jgi:hypothetical protein